MNLIISKHAQDMMIARGISKDQVKETIRKGSKYRQTDGILSVYTYIKVAYKVRGNKYIIKTVMVG